MRAPTAAITSIPAMSSGVIAAITASVPGPATWNVIRSSSYTTAAPGTPAAASSMYTVLTGASI